MKVYHHLDALFARDKKIMLKIVSFFVSIKRCQKRITEKEIAKLRQETVLKTVIFYAAI